MNLEKCLLIRSLLDVAPGPYPINFVYALFDRYIQNQPVRYVHFRVISARDNLKIKPMVVHLWNIKLGILCFDDNEC